ncbi:LacI family DNA-binding transcriptional regulator [Roseospira visakhapatnamensis]|uniref:DNA-binding LacI/PurR family transcriptional regulator n=1 Tax=Roseospira visakhapatnamensis TaxID=390880 RepID=A0A7W6W9W9_9PROT|nr:LacI family DNA-binding transcriptional regulator [Roseospira visakhapatnamensis]MBB4266389.1 DNA-binding LacI/PurR family transcriptional regulator [Roseospira visakhapatnamensis]
MTTKKIRNMEDFALATGISRPTISKYFNDPGSVRRSTREKIERALSEFDYRPNMFAVNMNRQKSKNIGVIVPSLSDPFYAEIVRQIEIMSLREGYWAINLSSHGEQSLEAKAIETFLALKLSGAIIAALGYESDLSLIDGLGRNMPLVFLDSRIANTLPFVGTDNTQSISLIVEYLCRTGEQPVFLEMPALNSNAASRREAYQAAMTRLGLEPRVLPVQDKSWNFEQVGFDETNRILDAGGFPTRTVLCANDRLAFGVMAAAYQRGLRVGRKQDADLRVAAHDDHPLSRYTCPALTTVAQDYSQLARSCLDLLLDRIGDTAQTLAPRSNSPLTLLETKLMMRDSA